MTVEKVKYIGENDYGDSKYIVSMKDEDGNNLNSFTTGKLKYVSKGETLRITSTSVSSHKEFKGKKQTNLKNIRFKYTDPVKLGKATPDELKDFLNKYTPEEIENKSYEERAMLLAGYFNSAKAQDNWKDLFMDYKQWKKDNNFGYGDEWEYEMDQALIKEESS